MKDSVLKRISDEYKDIKMITEGDFSEIEELEKDPTVRRYKHLLALKSARFEFENEDIIIGHLMSMFEQRCAEDTNDIWCLVYELPYNVYEERFNSTVDGASNDSPVLVYFDIENNQRHVAITKSEQESFESTHRVVVGKLSIQDSADRYYNVRQEFYQSCIKDGQEVAVKKILKKYSKPKDVK